MKSLNKDQRGSIYIYVLIVMISIFIMLNFLVNITKNSAIISSTTSENLNLYFMTKSGIEKGVYSLNNILYENKLYINNKVLEEISNKEFLEIVIFIPDYDDPYRGEFHIKNINYNETLYKNIFIQIANKIILQELRNMNLSHDIENYSIDINIINNNIINTSNYIIRSVATNNINARSLVLEANVSYSKKDHNLILNENYKWESIPNHFYEGVYSNLNIDEIFNFSIFHDADDWSLYYPIFLVNSNYYDIDISKFYNNLEPIPSIIINNNYNEIYLHSYSSNNIFRGIVISRGDILISENIYIEGILLSGSDIYYYSNVKINYDIIFEFLFQNNSDRRKLFDALYLTRYYEKDGMPFYKLTICSTSPIKIIGEDFFYFEIINLRQIN